MLRIVPGEVRVAMNFSWPISKFFNDIWNKSTLYTASMETREMVADSISNTGWGTICPIALSQAGLWIWSWCMSNINLVQHEIILKDEFDSQFEWSLNEDSVPSVVHDTRMKTLMNE